MIKKFVSYLATGIFISSCATPKAIDIMQANDEVMTCNELRLAFEKADLNEDEAHASKGVTICKRRKTDIPRFKGPRISMAINFGKKGMPNTNIRKSERITPV